MIQIHSFYFYLHRKSISKSKTKLYLNEAFDLFQTSYPFDWRTSIGYLAAFSSQAFSFMCIRDFILCVIILLIGFYFCVDVFVSDIEVSLLAFNKLISTKPMMRKQKLKLKEALQNVIQFHADVLLLSRLDIMSIPCKYNLISPLRFSGNFANTFSYVVTVVLSYGMGGLCSNLLMANTVNFI